MKKYWNRQTKSEKITLISMSAILIPAITLMFAPKNSPLFAIGSLFLGIFFGIYLTANFFLRTEQPAKDVKPTIESIGEKKGGG